MSAAPPLDHYAGPLLPDFGFDCLSRDALGRLGREFMLFAHFHDRALMPLLGRRFGPAAMTDVACDEWMGASPIYSRRVRRLLGIEGDGVPAILKAFQLDVGFPHQYMDVHYELVSEMEGYFWLPFCGAYEDVNRISRGAEPAIIQLCHHMQDPTFDATVMAVNPSARARPEHRPPLRAGHSGPTCRWRVFIGEEAAPVDDHAITRAVAATRAAHFRFHALPAELGVGLADYGGPFLPDFTLEALAQPVLARQCREFALDVHLLMRAAFASIRGRWGDDAAVELARQQWEASAPIYVPRVRAALGIAGDDVASILKTLQVDPALPHEYVRRGCSLAGGRGRFWIESCEAFEEGEPDAWLGLLRDAERPGIDATVASVNPRARCTPLDPACVETPGGAVLHAWEIEVDPSAEPRPESPMANAVRASNASSFQFRARRPV